jgi:hypothetical protein
MKMKYMKFIVPLAIVAVMLMVAMPVAADDPFGGPPSRTSGNGASTWAAIYVKGACSAASTLPSFSSRWFKYDATKEFDQEVYVDDVPKYGAAYNYFDGQDAKYGNSDGGNGNDIRLNFSGPRAQYIPVFQTKEQAQSDYWGNTGEAFKHGIAARLYDPDNINNMDYLWPTPNNALLTTRVGSRARVGDTEGSYNGYNRGGFTVGVTHAWLRHYDIKMADGQTHLLSGRYHHNGWVYVRAYNAMIWDNDITVCENNIRRNDYNFPNTSQYGTNPP